MARRDYPEVSLHVLADLDDAARTRLLERTEHDLDRYFDGVDRIIETVRQDGDEALARFAREFDRAALDADAIAATSADIDAAFEALEPEMLDVLEAAADSIRRFHEVQMPRESWMTEIRPGVLVGERYTPIESVACYSPRGKGSFPVVTLMTAIPAVVAGVPAPIVLTPPGPDGGVDAATLVAARLSGVEAIYKCGGAQAVAAVAFGTATVPRCRKIVGPGSPWLVAAKRRLAGLIDPGLPAGPSESVLLADASTNPLIAALDMTVESEHGPDSGVFLVTWERALAEAVRDAIPHYWDRMSDQRAEFSSTVLSGLQGGIVLAPDRDAAYAFVNDYAPEHLQVLGTAPFEHLAHLRHASEILLGEHAAGSMANYMLGPNCVLPTSGAAHTHSPLGVRDYLKSASIAHVTESGYHSLAAQVNRFARYEGFDAHANAVSPLRDAAHVGRLPDDA